MRASALAPATAALVITVLQAAMGVHQIANVWQRGHIGYNGAAYHQAARNTLRWGEPLPAQYVVGARKPEAADLYGHAPLALHAQTVAAVALLGDRPEAVRAVPLVHGVLAAVALFLVVLRFWGWPAALLASAIYVLLPINAIYAHMSNHSTGFLFWSLVLLYAYLRWIGASMHRPSKDAVARSGHRGWLALVFAAAFMAMQWDWPAYYVAFVLAVHWALRRTHVAWLALFCAMVLASFGGFFAFVAWQLGGLEGLVGTFRARSEPVGAGELWDRVLAPMFGGPLLVLCVCWAGGLAVRLTRGRAHARDLVPVAFALSGVMHTALFRTTAVIHPYWPWPLNPFVAIAAAEVLLWAARRAGRWIGRVNRRPSTWATAVVLGAFALWYLPFSARAYWEGRRVYGSVGYQGYDAGYLDVRFAEHVRRWTDPRTTLVAYPGLAAGVQFVVTADRHTVRAADLDDESTREVALRGPLAFVGSVREVPRHRLAGWAARHRYRQVGGHFMVDRTRQGPDVRVWTMAPRPASIAWRYLVNPWHGPHALVRDRDAEEALLSEALGHAAKDR
jgi:4-amino-4-deoxy-L-arabinose transferase-like glycosyltransferase